MLTLGPNKHLVSPKNNSECTPKSMPKPGTSFIFPVGISLFAVNLRWKESP